MIHYLQVSNQWGVGGFNGYRLDSGTYKSKSVYHSEPPIRQQNPPKVVTGYGSDL